MRKAMKRTSGWLAAALVLALAGQAIAGPDADGDGLDDADELTAGTDPNDPDSDGDGILDGPEVHTYFTNPLSADGDSDGLSDYLELMVWSTDPNDSTTDADLWSDGDEVLVYGTDPNQQDMDGDGIRDDLDADPTHGVLAGYGGSANAAFTGARSGLIGAASGLSPRDGVNVLLVEGSLQYSLTSAHAKGVRGVDFILGLQYDNQSRWDGLFGMCWNSIMDARRTVAGGSGDVTLYLGGCETLWVQSSPGVYTTPAGLLAVMTEDSGVYTITSPGGAFVSIGANGVTEQGDRFGNSITYSYTAGQAVTATDSRGEAHAIEYYSTGRFKKITMADGAVWEAKYNTMNQLWLLIGPATSSFPSGIVTEFRYSNGNTTAALNDNLIAVADGNGAWWLRNVYDGSDRVTRQYVGGSNHFDFDYSNAGSQEVTVTDRAGNERVWQWHSTKLTKSSLVEKTNRGVRGGEGDYTTTWTTDSDGYLLTTTYPRGNGVKRVLNAVKQPTEVRRKEDMGVADSPTNDLIEQYTYDSEKFYAVSTYIDPEGHETTYSLNADGLAETVTFETITHTTPDVTITNEYTFNADGTVASFTDGEGFVTTYAYYTTGPRTGRLHEKVVDAGGLDLTTAWDYEDWGDTNSVTDPRGNTTTYTVERYGNVEAVEGPIADYETQFDYDENLNAIERRVRNVDWDGTLLSTPTWFVTQHTYSTMDKVTWTHEEESSLDRDTQFTYDANDNLVQHVWGGRTTYMTYDERDLLYRRTREASPATDPVEQWDYDGNRNLVTFTNPRSKTTTYEYDLFDRRTKSINALGHYELLVHDKDGQVTERKSYEEAGGSDVLMAHHKSTYDEMHRCWKEEDALISGSTTWYARTYEFDDRGLPTTVNDRRNYDTTFTYDGAGRRLTTTDALGNVTTLEPDENGNVTAVEEAEIVPGGSPETFRTEFEFDAMNRMKKRIVIDRLNIANSHVTEWKRDSLSVVRKEIDPKGNVTMRVHDDFGRVTEEHVDMGSSAEIETNWDYNPCDQVSTLRDDNGNETTYAYDSLGRLETKTYENSKQVSYEYDLNGNVERIEDQNGTLVDQGFDDLDRLIGRDVTPGSAAVIGDTEQDFAYDALNRLTEATDDDSTVQLTYDSLSRVLTEVQGSNPLSTTGKTVTYTWDAEDNRTKIDYPSGFDANETRDAVGRVSAIVDGSSNTVASFDLYGGGLRRKKVTFQNGTYAATTYDGYRRPTDIAHKTSGHSQFAGFGYGWDLNDNPLFEERSHQSGKGDVYSYDKANRLTKVLRDCDDPSAEVATPNSEAYVNKLEYNMDDVFNLTSYVTTPYGGSPTTLSYTTDAMNQYTAIGGASPTYTDAGSLEDDGTFTYKYDAFQHLCEVKQGGTTIATYTYDALGRGRRTGKVVGSDTTRYVYADQQSIEEYDGTGSGANMMRLFVFGEQIDQVVMMEAPDYGDVDSDSNTSEVLRFNYHTQLIGSVTQVTGPSGSVVEQYLYDPYGKPTIKDGGGSTISASAIQNPYLYTGRQLDEETGLYHYRARLYSPEMRRFIQRDPLEYVDGPNATTYVRSRVTTAQDPLGLCQPPAVSPGGRRRGNGIGPGGINIPTGGIPVPTGGNQSEEDKESQTNERDRRFEGEPPLCGTGSKGEKIRYDARRHAGGGYFERWWCKGEPDHTYTVIAVVQMDVWWESPTETGGATAGPSYDNYPAGASSPGYPGETSADGKTGGTDAAGVSTGAGGMSNIVSKANWRMNKIDPGSGCIPTPVSWLQIRWQFWRYVIDVTDGHIVSCIYSTWTTTYTDSNPRNPSTGPITRVATP